MQKEKYERAEQYDENEHDNCIRAALCCCSTVAVAGEWELATHYSYS